MSQSFYHPQSTGPSGGRCATRPRHLALAALVLLLAACTPLGAKGPLRMVYYNDFPPYSFEDEQGEVQGIFVEIFREIIERRMGIEMVHQAWPWARAQNFVRRGEADGYCSVPTQERSAYVRFNQVPLIVATFTLFAPREHPRRDELHRIETLSDLHSFTLVSYIGSSWAKNALKDLEVYWPSGLEQALTMVDHGRADMVVDVSAVIKFKIRRLGLSDRLIELPAVLDRRQFNLCISEKSPYVDIVPQFDSHLRQMKRDGALQAILERY